MDFNKMSVEQLLLNDSFLRYCLQSNEEDIIFWENWMMGNPARKKNVTEAKALYTMLNGGHNAELVKNDLAFFIGALATHTSFEQQVKDDSLCNKSVTKLPSKIIRIALWSAAIAAIFLVVFLVNWDNPLQLKKESATASNTLQQSLPAERKSFQLPDGTSVMLNAGSTLEILDGFNNATREIKLIGEAFFDVAHNAKVPFIIHTSAMSVKVLGTVFNIKAYAGEAFSETSLIKGSVEVTLLNKSNKKVLLRPNQKIIVANINTDVIVTRNTSTVLKAGEEFLVKDLSYNETDSLRIETGWTENKLAFDDKSFEEIALQLERWYNVKIVFEDNAIKQLHFSGIFEQKTLTQVLDYLQLTNKSFQYKMEENKQVIITK